jgi:lysophospholipase L1-like esterase
VKAKAYLPTATVALALLLGITAPAIRAADAFAGHDTVGKTNAAIVPVPRDDKWLKRHENFVAIAKEGNFDLLFLGDSITDFWRSRGKAVWEQNFAPLKAENFGISGDRTQHVLWRIEHGELDGAHPKLIVLMIGTNNSKSDSATEIAEGVTAIVKQIQAKCPASTILLLAIFPRANMPDEEQNTQITGKIKDTNKIIAGLDDGKSIKFLDIGAKFLDSDGKLPKNVMPDLLHPNEKGYQIWADAILPIVKEMMK